MMAMNLLKRLFAREADPKEAMRPLYLAVVTRARTPDWYVEGAVPDTLDGRFDMIAVVMSLTLLRLEQLGKAQEQVWLTELFVDDMEGQLRQIGVGDVIVGKHVGRMMSALGGRLGAYRDTLDDPAALEQALARNLYRGEAVAPDALAWCAAHVRILWTRFQTLAGDRMLAGELG